MVSASDVPIDREAHSCAATCGSPFHVRRVRVGKFVAWRVSGEGDRVAPLSSRPVSLPQRTTGSRPPAGQKDAAVDRYVDGAHGPPRQQIAKPLGLVRSGAAQSSSGRPVPVAVRSWFVQESGMSQCLQGPAPHRFAGTGRRCRDDDDSHVCGGRARSGTDCDGHCPCGMGITSRQTSPLLWLRGPDSADDRGSPRRVASSLSRCGDAERRGYQVSRAAQPSHRTGDAGSVRLPLRVSG